MPRLRDCARRERKIDVRVVSSSKMVDAGALDSAALVGNLDLRSDTSGVEIHLGAGDYPGYRTDRLFGVSTVAVASPELVKGKPPIDRKSTRLNSSHANISYAVFCLKKKKQHDSPVQWSQQLV